MLCRLALFGLLLIVTLAPSHAQESAPPQPDIAPLPLVETHGQDILNVLLIGAATSYDENPGMTDALLVVSVNRDAGSVAILSIPRDLYVHIPDFGMGKINQAYFLAEMRSETWTGLDLLKATVEYNLGLPIDYTLRINFDHFEQLIDAVGGVTLTVDCIIRDWRIIDPEGDQEDPDNYEMYTLPLGRHHLDGETALWYVRSRRTSTDIDRGRRQQDVLRALWRRIQARDLLADFPALWEQMTQLVETDIPLDVALSFVPLALETSTADIDYFTFRMRYEVENDYTDDDARRAILVPQRVAVQRLIEHFMLPPTRNRIALARPTVAVINASGISGLDYVAADRLELEGFRTEVVNEWSPPRDYNHIIDYTGVTKGNPIGLIQRTLRVTDAGVAAEPQADSAYDYRVYIGNTYQFYACTRAVIQPDMSAEIEAAATP